LTDSDYAQRRLIDQTARRRLPPSPVDFMVVNDSTNPDRLPARSRGWDTARTPIGFEIVSDDFPALRRKAEFSLFSSLHGNDKVIKTHAITLSLRRVRPAGKTYLSGRRVAINSHRAGGGRNRSHPVTRHGNTGCCSECVAHFLCGLHDPLWLCRAHDILCRISSKCRCAECQREHDTSASNR
jgi:hypothetical protein